MIRCDDHIHAIEKKDKFKTLPIFPTRLPIIARRRNSIAWRRSGIWVRMIEKALRHHRIRMSLRCRIKLAMLRQWRNALQTALVVGITKHCLNCDTACCRGRRHCWRDSHRRHRCRTLRLWRWAWSRRRRRTFHALRRRGQGFDAGRNRAILNQHDFRTASIKLYRIPPGGNAAARPGNQRDRVADPSIRVREIFERSVPDKCASDPRGDVDAGEDADYKHRRRAGAKDDIERAVNRYGLREIRRRILHGVFQHVIACRNADLEFVIRPGIRPEFPVPFPGIEAHFIGILRGRPIRPDGNARRGRLAGFFLATDHQPGDQG